MSLKSSTRRNAIVALATIGFAVSPRHSLANEKNSMVTGSVMTNPAGTEFAELSSLPAFQEGEVPVTGGVLHYIAGGEGDRTIVLLHKLGGWALEWRWIMPILATRMRVVAVDLAGHGASDMHGAPPYIATQEEIAAQLMALLDSLGEDNVIIAGSSLGGCIGTVCAAFWPERIAALVTVGSAIADSRSRESLKKSDLQYITDGMFDENDTPLPRDPSYMDRIFGMRNPDHMEDMVSSRIAAGRWIQPCTRGVALFDHNAVLHRITAPVLMLYGTNGAYGRFVEDAVARLSNGRGVPVNGASAFPHQDFPEYTANAIFDFLDV